MHRITEYIARRSPEKALAIFGGRSYHTGMDIIKGFADTPEGRQRLGQWFRDNQDKGFCIDLDVQSLGDYEYVAGEVMERPDGTNVLVLRAGLCLYRLAQKQIHALGQEDADC